ncbi:MAG: septal ring lytic transglycosylase RlpA family protein [Lonepinella koalarum]|nr:septal ring lytic transglycosylase RlpA family protein [Lonepinella koalarum]
MKFKLFFTLLLSMLLSACSTTEAASTIKKNQISSDYVVNGKHYSIENEDKKHYLAQGGASYYAKKFTGKRTASGEKYDPKNLTAAHRTLPFGTMVLVTNMQNKKQVVVRINDRGPFTKGRIIDLSKAAAAEIDMIRFGVAKVKVEQLHLKKE